MRALISLLKNRFFRMVTAAALLGAMADAQAQNISVDGVWSGSIATPGTPLGLTVTLQRSDNGAWTGAADIPAQGAAGLPLGEIVVNGLAVSFRLLAGAGNPNAVLSLSGDGERLSGFFRQAGASFPLELTRGAAPAPRRPQTPTRPFPYREEEVSYRNEAAQIRVAGALTLPEGKGPFPAALLITGSGPQDRDETIAGHKPFLVLADHLTRRGLAVLRADDRGVGGTDAGPATVTTLDLALDVRAGLAYLRSRPEIDRNRIGLIGHSEGANIAAIVAADDPETAFIVMLAGAGIRGDQILFRQAAAIARSQGASDEVIAWDREIRERVYALIMSEPGGVADIGRRDALIRNARPAPQGPPASGSDLAATLLQGASSAWFRHFLAYDPAAPLRRVRAPVLAVIGGNDLQVSPAENLPAIRNALEAADNRDATVVNLPGLNHLFQTSETGSVLEYGVIEETFAPSALSLVSDWILARTQRR